MPTILKYWGPVIAWMLVIVVASSDVMSAQHTSRFIAPFLRWISPEISLETIRAVQFAVRKAAHVIEYAILSALLVRAFHTGFRPLHFAHGCAAFLIATAYAALDEYHQSFVASRTGSPRDVLIDASGALLGIVICWWLIAKRGRSPRVLASGSVAETSSSTR